MNKSVFSGNIWLKINLKNQIGSCSHTVYKLKKKHPEIFGMFSNFGLTNSYRLLNKFTPSTIAHAPGVNAAPVAVVLVVKFPTGKVTVNVDAPTPVRGVLSAILKFNIFILLPSTWFVLVLAS